jgi:hypothetical protein
VDDLSEKYIDTAIKLAVPANEKEFSKALKSHFFLPFINQLEQNLDPSFAGRVDAMSFFMSGIEVFLKKYPQFDYDRYGKYFMEVFLAFQVAFHNDEELSDQTKLLAAIVSKHDMEELSSIKSSAEGKYSKKLISYIENRIDEYEQLGVTAPPFNELVREYKLLQESSPSIHQDCIYLLEKNLLDLLEAELIKRGYIDGAACFSNIFCIGEVNDGKAINWIGKDQQAVVYLLYRLMLTIENNQSMIGALRLHEFASKYFLFHEKKRNSIDYNRSMNHITTRYLKHGKSNKCFQEIDLILKLVGIS